MRVAASMALSLCILLAGCYPDLDWRPLTPPDARFTVLMPAKSQEDSRPIAGGATMHMWSTKAGDTVFGAGYADYPDEARNHVSAVRDALIGKSGNKMVEDREITLHDMMGRAVRIEAAADGASASGVTSWSMARRCMSSCMIAWCLTAGHPSKSPPDCVICIPATRASG